MLKLTKKADYGLIAMRHLAESSGEACSAKDLAEAYGIPQEALAKILQRLARAGLLLSHHGVNGGYILGRDARKISVFDVIQAIEGPLFMTSCYMPARRECEQSSKCNIREPLRRVGESIQGVLMRLTLADMRSGDHSEAEGNGHKAAHEFVTLA
jgi:FeS assembly SUF system regulator